MADLSIIIVNWNTRQLLQDCIRSIYEHRGPLAVQLIVVDNSSIDGSREMVAQVFPEVVLINSGGNLGFARANNLGLQHAAAPLVLFLNPDTEVRSGALGQMVEFMHQNASVGALGCKIRNANGNVQPLGLQWFPSPLTELLKWLAVTKRTCERLPAFFPQHNPEVSGDVKKLFGACLLVRRSVLEEVGGFDERFFMYCEDVDLCYRIRSASWRLYYLAEAEVLHHGGGASENAAELFTVLMSCESFAKLMRKYYGVAGAVAYRVVMLVGAQLRLAALMAIRLSNRLRLRCGEARLYAAQRKYIAITKWTLGFQRAIIRE